MNRKYFLQTTAMGTAALFFSGFLKLFGKENSNRNLPVSESSEEIVIIGSGYGGAVTALRLCEKGHKVTMLEMGLNWENSGEKFSAMRKPGKSAAWLRNITIAPFMNVFPLKKFTGTLERWDFPNIKIWMGRGVGGGSLVNGGMAVTPKKEYFKEVFPQLDTELFYQKYFPLANKELGVNIASEEFLKSCDYYKFSQVGEEEAHKAGFRTVRVPNVYDFGYMEKEYRNEVPRSALAGEVIYGNNHGKKSLDKTYLKKALHTGNLSILDLHKVEILAKNPDGYTLDISQINTKGEVIAKKFLHTKKLFLTAGTMGTLELLLKSHAENGFPIDENIGKEWGNNGNFMTGRNFVKTFSGGTGLNHSTIPVGGIDNWDDPEHPFFTEIAPLPMGLNVLTTLYLMVNKIKKLGSVGYDKADKKLILNWDETNTQNMRENAEFFIKKMNKANGGTRARLLFSNGYGPDICYHPLGGAVIGKATNSFGRLNLHDNLYILDGSLVPGTIGVNPFVTITAVAEYCMDGILRNDFSND